ncbi:MAG: universal stress protein [Deltaproteobacteria bacterium]|nr:universal stress protein [Deltaproteobacteria bacterium]MBW2051146.1 universal stress protein [Deltaproteobacteria bacterium]MBW2139939.1 universal stress protein [Deltaproteobacteria bacterium]MBW2323889.1 universal stress protein [Deltaproteobacteria bacterium]
MVNKILVPVDGSDHAEKAIEFAANMARQNDAAIHLLHIIKVSSIPEGIEEFIRSESIKDSPVSVYFRTIGNGIISAAEDKARKAGIKNFVSSVLEGDPAETIIDYARENEFDIIVIGSRGMGSVKGLLLGSVSSKVCHASDRTCVTVK